MLLLLEGSSYVCECVLIGLERLDSLDVRELVVVVRNLGKELCVVVAPCLYAASIVLTLY